MQWVVAVFTDCFEYCHSPILSPEVLSLVSAEASGTPLCLETEAEEEHHSQAEVTDGQDQHHIHQKKLPDQSSNVSFQFTSHSVASTSSTTSSAQPSQRLPRMFSREKEQSAQVQSPETGNSHSRYYDVADVTENRCASVKHEAKLSGMTGVKTVQLTALQNTAFKETVTAAEADTRQEATEGRVVQFPERLSNLKAFWERENTGPKIIFTREESRQEDMAKAGTEASLGHLSNVLAQMERTGEATIGRSLEKSLSSQTESSPSVDFLKEDGAYRAIPVLIYEETDESLTGSGTESQIFELHENITTPSPFSGFPVSRPMPSSSSPQEDRPAKICDLKHFWEKEYIGPRVIVARVKEASNKDIYSQCDMKNRELSEGDEPTSPYRPKSKSLTVTDKGFVSPDRSQHRNSASASDLHSLCPQYPVKADIKSEARSLSPSHCRTPRSKDQNDEVRKSPSKTCHPRVLPKESFSPRTSRVEGSPLKTFPIDIDPQVKVVKGQEKRETHEPKQTALTEVTETYCGKPNPVNTQQMRSSSTSPSKKASERRLGTCTDFARSCIPQDYQHYLGPEERAHSPPFHQETVAAASAAAESDVVHRPQRALRDFVGNQTDSRKEWSPPTVSSYVVHSKQGDSCQDTTTWSLSRASSDSELLISLSIYLQDND